MAAAALDLLAERWWSCGTEKRGTGAPVRGLFSTKSRVRLVGGIPVKGLVGRAVTQGKRVANRNASRPQCFGQFGRQAKTLRRWRRRFGGVTFRVGCWVCRWFKVGGGAEEEAQFVTLASSVNATQSGVGRTPESIPTISRGSTIHLPSWRLRTAKPSRPRASTTRSATKYV
jgi:hypothetical protein